MTYVLAQTGLGAVLDNRPAAATGLLGAACCGLLTLLLAHASSRASRTDEGLYELPFVPGMTLALGSPEAEARVDDPGVAPRSPPVEPAEATPPTDAAEDPSTPEDDAVTDQVTPPAPPRPIRPHHEPTGPSSQPPRPSPLPAPPGPLGNPSKGDPFGDPSGLDDLASAGDAWARGVIAAIEAMDVGTAYAKPVAGDVRFQLTVCKDGTISKVAYKGGSASVDERDLVLLELGRLRIPRPPAAIAAHMDGSCAKIRHTFSWTVAATR